MVAVDNIDIHVGGITPFTTIDFPADWQPLFSVRVVPGVVVTAITGICSSPEKQDSIPGTKPSDGLKPDGDCLMELFSVAVSLVAKAIA